MRDRETRAPGVASDKLQRREGSRLWFRAPQPDRPAEALSDHQTNDLRTGHFTRSHPREGTGRLNATQSLQAVVGPAAPKKHARDMRTLTEWTDAPRHCPIVLLSANQVMDGRLPGPMLGPGTRYRIVSVAEGIACVQVQALDGQVGLGYCKALDLVSYEPEIMYLGGDKRGRRLANLKLGRRATRPAGAMAS